jgi:signal transduction histidine kinase
MPKITHRERELGAIINSYNEVTERLKQSHDRLRGEVVRLHDQLDEKNRELARRERLAALGEMAAGVAHEIRNPLGGIRLYADLLIKDLREMPAAQQLARRVSDGVSVLESIVGDVVEFAGESEPDVSTVRAGALIEEALGLAAPAITSRGCDLHLKPIAEDLFVWADVNQILRALLNLLLNAVDAAGEGGAIDVSVAVNAAGTHCEFLLADDGPGVSPDFMNRIFHPFFTTKSSGTGLGLAIVHRIADAHGGSVRARNRDGGGAEFCLSLPVGEAPQLEKRTSTRKR